MYLRGNDRHDSSFQRLIWHYTYNKTVRHICVINEEKYCRHSHQCWAYFLFLNVLLRKSNHHLIKLCFLRRRNRLDKCRMGLQHALVKRAVARRHMPASQFLCLIVATRWRHWLSVGCFLHPSLALRSCGFCRTCIKPSLSARRCQRPRPPRALLRRSPRQASSKTTPPREPHWVVFFKASARNKQHGVIDD